jgi:hypothetical protein
MNDRPGTIPPGLLRRSGEVALLTVIDAVLDVPVDELPGRVALVRRYLEAALEAIPDTRRTAFLVIAQMLFRDASRDRATDG